MHSFLAYTSMELHPPERQRLIAALTAAGCAVFPCDFSLTLHFVPECYSAPNARQLLHFIAHVPEDISMRERRAITRALHDATVHALGADQNQRATVLFWKAAPEDIYYPERNA